MGNVYHAGDLGKMRNIKPVIYAGHVEDTITTTVINTGRY